jgi:hypothetical protein
MTQDAADRLLMRLQKDLRNCPYIKGGYQDDFMKSQTGTADGTSPFYSHATTLRAYLAFFRQSVLPVFMGTMRKRCYILPGEVSVHTRGRTLPPAGWTRGRRPENHGDAADIGISGWLSLGGTSEFVFAPGTHSTRGDHPGGITDDPAVLDQLAVTLSIPHGHAVFFVHTLSRMRRSREIRIPTYLLWHSGVLTDTTEQWSPSVVEELETLSVPTLLDGRKRKLYESASELDAPTALQLGQLREQMTNPGRPVTVKRCAIDIPSPVPAPLSGIPVSDKQIASYMDYSEHELELYKPA